MQRAKGPCQKLFGQRAAAPRRSKEGEFAITRNKPLAAAPRLEVQREESAHG